MTTSLTERLKSALRGTTFPRGTSAPRPRLHGSSDIEDRDLARVLADLRITRPAARGPEE